VNNNASRPPQSSADSDKRQDIVTDARLPTYRVCGIPIAAATLAQATEAVVSAASSRRQLQVHLCNVFTLSSVAQDLRLSRALKSGDLNLPDGTPVAWLGKRRGIRKPTRGPELLPAVIKLGSRLRLRHYFYGGHEGVADELASWMAVLEPELRVAGTQTPPFRDLEDKDVEALAEDVRAAAADVLWIGLGTPRQDYLVHDLSDRLSIPVVPVGAAFDFLTGRVAEAPSWLHGSGLEWIYRLSRDPKRLWRRYVYGNPRFVGQVVRERLARES